MNLKKNSVIDREIEVLKGYVQKDSEVIYDDDDKPEGLSKLEYRVKAEQGNIEALLEMIEKKDFEEGESEVELLKQIQEHKGVLKGLFEQMVEIPQSITRLDTIRSSKQDEVKILFIPSSTSREEISQSLKAIDKQLMESLPDEERRVLVNLKNALDNAKTGIDSGIPFNDIQFYVHQSELEFLNKIPELIIKNELSEKKETEPEVEAKVEPEVINREAIASDVVEPKPDVIEPKPDVIEPKPDVIEPKPDVIEPKPDVIEPKPDVIEPKTVQFMSATRQSSLEQKSFIGNRNQDTNRRRVGTASENPSKSLPARGILNSFNLQVKKAKESVAKKASELLSDRPSPSKPKK